MYESNYKLTVKISNHINLILIEIFGIVLKYVDINIYKVGSSIIIFKKFKLLNEEYTPFRCNSQIIS